MTISLAFNRSTISGLSRYVALTEFASSRLRGEGIPPERITIIPNYADDPGDFEGIGNGFLFVGRLEPEKGVGLLLEAWRRSSLGTKSELVVVGDGSLQAEVQAASAVVPGISYRGSVPSSEVLALRRSTAVAIVPSLWFEPLPLAVIESFAAARPVLTTGLGSLPELVDESVGWTSQPTSVALATAMTDLHSDQAGVLTRARNARQLYLERYTEKTVYGQLVELYRSVSEDRHL